MAGYCYYKVIDKPPPPPPVCPGKSWVAMKSNNYREQVQMVSSWFKDWSECEQTVALYSLLKKSSPIQARFLDQVLQQSLAECSDVQQWEAKANDEGNQ